ncbi:hypothetical protein [Verrucomicrobium sp. BvORR034]|uniref:hypothetical protein n=1 Tax=Verrucomicrobium sp. BvORR034 TaxID=1396418 RepID=UPI000678460C|nr:hypothetical protein [Verrucomicrobium sp. BvORR034]
MNHPLFHFFGVEGTRDVGATVRYPLGGRGRKRCEPCQRWYGAPDFREIEATLSRIREGDYYEGSPAVEAGPHWPEAISVLIEPPLVRGDIVAVMQKAGVSGFIPRKVRLTINDGRAFTRPVPEYFQIEITGRVAISYPESEVTICPLCLSRTDHNFGDKLMVPDLDTWTGDDLVKPSNVSSGYVLTTRKLIDLARENGWSTFQFGTWIPHCRVNFMAEGDWHADVVARTRLKYRRYFERERSV